VALDIAVVSFGFIGFFEPLLLKENSTTIALQDESTRRITGTLRCSFILSGKDFYFYEHAHKYAATG